MSYCFDDDTPFVCEKIQKIQLLPYYLDIFDLTCNEYCRKGYMRALRDTDEIGSQYCSKSCSEFVKDCYYEQELYITTFISHVKQDILIYIINVMMKMIL